MTHSAILALIFTIAVEYGVPPKFAQAVALTENSTLNPEAVNVNKNGTRDLGIFQLNSVWYKNPEWNDPEQNIRDGVKRIKWLMSLPEINTYWAVALAYHSGLEGMKDPLKKQLEYADNVINKWNELSGGNALTIIRGGVK